MELQRRSDAAGGRLLSVAAHPGVAATNLVGSGPMRRIPGLAQLATAVNSLWSQPAAHGAVAGRSTPRPGPGLWCGGEYVGPCADPG